MILLWAFLVNDLIKVMGSRNLYFVLLVFVLRGGGISFFFFLDYN